MDAATRRSLLAAGRRLSHEAAERPSEEDRVLVVLRDIRAFLSIIALVTLDRMEEERQ